MVAASIRAILITWSTAFSPAAQGSYVPALGEDADVRSGLAPEWQEFFRSEAKPKGRFRGRGSAPLMAGRGWIAEWRLWYLAGPKKALLL
jgi:hypothetical protein